MRRMGDVSQDKVRVRVDGLDYESMFGFSRLFRSFHMALHPAKLLLAMLLVILLYLGGLAMDLVWGAPVQPGEIDAYVAATVKPDISGGSYVIRLNVGAGESPRRC